MPYNIPTMKYLKDLSNHWQNHQLQKHSATTLDRRSHVLLGLGFGGMIGTFTSAFLTKNPRFSFVSLCCITTASICLLSEAYSDLAQQKQSMSETSISSGCPFISLDDRDE